MSMISLAVTVGVLRQEKVNGTSARQLAIRDASKEVKEVVQVASKKRKVAILLADRVRLFVGDTSAIWRAQNPDSYREFDLLFDLLALRPDSPMKFRCELLNDLTI